MRATKFAAITALAIPLVFGGYSRSLHGQPAPGTPAGIRDDDDRDRNRDAREMGRRDGMQAAYNDMRDRRKADADDHQNYRHPPVDKHVRNDYRAGFRDGYNDGVRNASRGVRDYDNDRRDGYGDRR